MSNQQDNLDTKLSDAKATANRLLNQRKRGSTAIETANPISPKDYALWAIAIVALVGATLVNQYLPGYWAPASDVWVRIGVIVSLIVFGLFCLAITSQGAAFKVLLKDAGVELRRVTWPTKNETITWTWLSIVFMILFGIIVWALDTIFNPIIGYIIG